MRRNNLFYFDYSKNHPEPIFDSYYIKDKVIIPPTPEKKNTLTSNNEKLIDLITAFDVNRKLNNTRNTATDQIVKEIKNILDKVEYINYSALCQFFMVYNSSYASYSQMKPDEKIEFLYEILDLYCKERHSIYKSHGYSNSSLQILCDNYSHKRNSKTSINKFCDLLVPLGFHELSNIAAIETDDAYYFLPDKNGTKLFDAMLKNLDMKMESRAIEQSKRPDIVFKYRGHYYVFELKTMKSSGGGQNKQAVEFAYFIRFSESNPNIHYGVFLDSQYANIIFSDKSPKISEQRSDIQKALNQNSGNYFVNTAGIKCFLDDLVKGDC